jgi:hypothetical protein
MRLCFVAPQGGSAFMHELLEVVAGACADVGAQASLHVGPYPSVPGSSVFVVIPHEYFALTPAGRQPDAELRRRTIAFCVEHPGNATFAAGARHAATLGAAVDINRDSTRALQQAGIPAHHFTLGYSARWDAWHGDRASPRPIDLTYMGTTDARRDFLLARQAGVLAALETRLLIPPHELMTRPRPDFLVGDDKLAHLAASKILLNLHRGGSRSLEWVRVLEAICNGCAVVSETSVAFEPLVPGRHVVFARAANTATVATVLLRRPDRLAAIRDAAYELARAIDMAPSAHTLVDIAEALVSGRTPPRPAHDISAPAGSWQSYPAVPEPSRPPHGLPELTAPWASVPAHVRESQAEVIESLLAHTADTTVKVIPAPIATPPRVRALVPVVGGDRAMAALTTRSLRNQDVAVAISEARLDGDVPPGRGVEWASRGALLNVMLAGVVEEYVLVIEPGQELFPTGCARLVRALDSDPAADAAYGFMADVVSGVLWNALPFEAERIERRAYLSAPFLVRTGALRALGGFATGAALAGYEHHQLWLRFARAGRTAAFVQQVVGRGQPVVAQELSIARVAPELALAALEATQTLS